MINRCNQSIFTFLSIAVLFFPFLLLSSPADSSSKNCDNLGAEVELSYLSFHPGERFVMTVVVCNPDAETYEAGLFAYITTEMCIPIMPELPCPEETVYWPGWRHELDYLPESVAAGEFRVELLDFIVPDNPSEMEWLFSLGSGIYYAQSFLSNTDLTQILGFTSVSVFEIEFESTPIPTMTPRPTYTPTVTPTPTQSPTPSQRIEPTFTETPIPTTTPTVFPFQGEIQLIIPDECVRPGDEFYVSIYTKNHSQDTFLDAAIFVVLDAYGALYFYPTWVFFGAPDDEIAFEIAEIRDENRIIIEAFTWPKLDVDLPNLYFYSALCDPGITELISNFAVIRWGAESDCS
jgi:hypothetical protein